MKEIEYLKQENKKLVEALDDYGNKNFKYEQALKKIREAILNYESKEWNCFNDMDAKLEKISEILDEVFK